VHLIYAREHGNEPDPTGQRRGAIEFLLSDDREPQNCGSDFVSIIPLWIPDGAANAVYDNITMSFVGRARLAGSDPYAESFRKGSMPAGASTWR